MRKFEKMEKRCAFLQKRKKTLPRLFRAKSQKTADKGQSHFPVSPKIVPGYYVPGHPKKSRKAREKSRICWGGEGARSTAFRSLPIDFRFNSDDFLFESDPKNTRYFLQNLKKRVLQVIFEAKRGRPRSHAAKGPASLILFLSFLIPWTALQHSTINSVSNQYYAMICNK